MYISETCIGQVCVFRNKDIFLSALQQSSPHGRMCRADFIIDRTDLNTYQVIKDRYGFFNPNMRTSDIGFLLETIERLMLSEDR